MTRRDDPDDFFFITYHMHDKQQCLGLRSANDRVSGFVWFGRIYNSRKRIKEHLAGKFEWHTVLELV